MTAQNLFTSLVQHEFKWKRQQNRSRKNRHTTSVRWGFLYMALAILIGFGLFTYAVIQGYIQPMYFWYFLFAIPFSALGLSHNVIYREWKDNTFSWWLTLPYSRMKLISAKFVACLLQMVIISAGVYLLIALLGLYAMLWQGMTFSSALTFLGWGMIWWLFSASALPFVVAFGMLSATIVYTQLKSLLPFLWVLFWLVWGGIIWISSIQEGEGNLFAFIAETAETGTSVYFPIDVFWLATIVVSWLLTYLFIWWKSRILERHLDL